MAAHFILFYTGKQAYYSWIHEAHRKLLHVKKKKNNQNHLWAQGLFSEKTKNQRPNWQQVTD